MDLGTIWFILWGVLWAVYFILDGFDLGLGTLLPFLAKTEDEKRFSDQLYLKAKTRIDLLFKNIEHDPQMKLIKSCVLNHLEERFLGE